jgi:hypothetical protein
MTLALLLAACAWSYAESVSGLRGRRITEGVELRWDNPGSPSAVRLRVQRRQPYGDYEGLTNLPVNISSWTDRRTHSEETYSYRVLSLDIHNDELGRSAPVEILPSNSTDYEDLIRFDENTLSLEASTSVSFAVSVPESGRVIVRILTPDFEVVKVLLDEKKPFGTYDLTWDGRNSHDRPVAPGLYLVSCSTPAGKSVAKMAVRP